MTTTPLELFLLGVLAALSLVVGLFFLKFWRKTRDALFLAFSASFFVRSLNDAIRASMPKPNDPSVWSFLVGMAASLLIVIAIVRKNMRKNGL